MNGQNGNRKGKGWRFNFRQSNELHPGQTRLARKQGIQVRSSWPRGGVSSYNGYIPGGVFTGWTGGTGPGAKFCASRNLEYCDRRWRHYPGI